MTRRLVRFGRGLLVTLVGYLALCWVLDRRSGAVSFPADATATPTAWPPGFLWGTATAAH